MALERDHVIVTQTPHVCGNECPPGDPGPVERVITALDDDYDVRPVGPEVVNLHDRLTGDYLLTVTLSVTA